jgi:hypothetical protein
MSQLAIALLCLSALAFNLLVWLGVQGLDSTTTFGTVAGVLNVLWPSSCVLMAVVAKRRRDTVAGVFAAANLAIFGGVLALHLAGVQFSRGLLYALDLVAINLLLVLVSRAWGFNDGHVASTGEST